MAIGIGQRRRPTAQGRQHRADGAGPTYGAGPTAQPDGAGRRHRPTAAADGARRRSWPTELADGAHRRSSPTELADGACRQSSPTELADGACRRSLPAELADGSMQPTEVADGACWRRLCTLDIRIRGCECTTFAAQAVSVLDRVSLAWQRQHLIWGCDRRLAWAGSAGCWGTL